MAKEYSFKAAAHPSIYKPCDREMNIYFAEPEQGINENTGILLFIAGFGGNAQSKVYKKMRSQFADKYNLVTVQCDYFGYEFMQNNLPFEIRTNKNELSCFFSEDEVNSIFCEDKLNGDKFLEYGSRYNVNVKAIVRLNETLGYFNDMNIMQSIDNLTALLLVIAIIKDNDYVFNSKKIIIYGHSHGAYLCHLCNIFAPSLFSLLIDNSAWLFPGYISHKRLSASKHGKMTINREYEYLAKKVCLDKDLLNLRTLYEKFDNNCRIVTFQGTNDNLVNHFEKRNFCSHINNCLYVEVDETKVDGEIFKSSSHGLDSDFLRLFDYVMAQVNFQHSNIFELPEEVIVTTSKNEYYINYSTFAH